LVVVVVVDHRDIVVGIDLIDLYQKKIFQRKGLFR
jgi:hypothetical protein